MHKLKSWKNKFVYGFISLFAGGTMLLQETLIAHAESLGEKAQNLANTAEQQALGLIEILGLVGVVGCGVLFAIGKKDLAKQIIVYVAIGYFILKYASPIWNIFKSGI
ncbi:TrbC/VirB2 family protein [Faecalicoccus pleomorphus]|uniref:TrbC/VirB2 family protein n=1 Tax=Faecalicoccus pleomorphus TaxID=1323 RepID=UPI0026F1D009|nr:TrbC/VirB2 family protein [Faecalicoccus pleomorphus]